MRPRKRPTADLLRSTQSILSQVPNGWPFQSISNQLKTLVDLIVSGYITDDHATAALNCVVSIFNLLPKTFGARFHFDAAMIQAIAHDWSATGTILSQMIVPVPGSDWGHSQIMMPREKNSSGHMLSFIHVPGSDDPGEIDLLSYPWLCHELAHNLLSKHGALFISSFSDRLSHKLGHQQRMLAAHRSSARALGEMALADMRKFWTPTSDHSNWAHECAIDIVGVWTCGPAYVDAFLDVAEDKTIDPFLIDLPHPPYHTRAWALKLSAMELGWVQAAGELQSLIERWQVQKESHPEANRYASLTSNDIVEELVAASHVVCQTFGLPKLSPVSLAATDFSDIDGLDFGVQVIVAAWFVRRQQGDNVYETWEKAAITNLLQRISVMP